MKPSAVYRNRLQRYADEVWLIWSNKWGCWYKADCCGYTSDPAKAGLYTRDEAARHYLGAVPRSHRDVEPFPLSSVRSMLTRKASELRAEADRLDKVLAA